MKRALHTYCLMLLCAVFVQGCSLIDDDLSVCGGTMSLELQMQLITNLDLELETTLSAETDLYTRTILHNYFSNIFTDHAHDIAIGFFNTTADTLVYSIRDVIDASQSTYTFYLPKDNYYAIAFANLEGNQVVTLADSTESRLTRLATPSNDTLPTQQTGVFTVAREIFVQDTADQKIDLLLHMATSAFALVIDTGAVHVTGIKAILCGMSDGLYVRDSLYTFNHPKVTRMEKITENKEQSPSQAAERTKIGLQDADTTRYYLLGCASFPSYDVPDGKGAYYEAKVYVQLGDSSVTETILDVRDPLDAGELKIVKLELQPDGSVKPTQNSEVGVSVTLDWKDGGTHNIVL